MKKILAGSVALLTILIVAGVVWSQFPSGQAILKSAKSANPAVIVGLVTASVTAIVSVLSILISKHLERRAQILQDLRSKKTPIYEKIIDTLFKVTFAGVLGEEQPTEKELLLFFTRTTQELVVWGSDDVLRAFEKFKTTISGQHGKEKQSTITVFCLEDFLFELRRDLGHLNKGMKRGSILRIFVNDIDDYL